MIISAHRLDRSMLALGGASRAGPIQLVQRQLPSRLLIELMRHRVHRALWGVDVYVGQQEQPLQRALLDSYRLRLGMWHNVAYVSEPAMLGDQHAFVPAITERPEVEPP